MRVKKNEKKMKDIAGGKRKPQSHNHTYMALSSVQLVIS